MTIKLQYTGNPHTRYFIICCIKEFGVSRAQKLEVPVQKIQKTEVLNEI